MSYLVLARKYRPQTFDDVVGQAHVVRPLKNALGSGRVAHSYLFSGARGVGKTTVARLLAMALNCSAEPDRRPCGVCEACLEISGGQAVDVFEIDGASNRGINEIRDLRETIRYLPSKGRYKVYIIDEVHMLTKEAFNALLKTLEEPPGHVIFIFATTEAHKVLPTILSRCQRYDFKRIKSDEIIDRLRGIAETEGITIGPNALRLLARESEGSLRDSLSLFDQVIAFSGNDVSDDHVADALGLIDQTLVSELARAVLDGRAGDAMDVLERVHGFGYDAKDFAAQVLAYHRALVVVKVSQRPEEILDLIDAEVKELNQAAAGVSLETLHFHFNAWLDVQNQLHRSTYPRLVLEALIVRLCQTREIQPLAELLAKFEALAGSAGAAGPPPDPSGSSGSPAGGTNPQRGGGGPGGSLPPEGRRSAPPAPAPAPAEGSAQLDWPGFVDSIRVDHPLLYSVLSQGAADEFSARKVVLTLADENHRNLLDRNKLNTLLTDNFGRRPEVQVEVAPTASTGPDPAAAARARREQAKTDVLAHPLVREAAEIFSGEMVDFIEEPAE